MKQYHCFLFLQNLGVYPLKPKYQRIWSNRGIFECQKGENTFKRYLGKRKFKASLSLKDINAFLIQDILKQNSC